MTTIESILKYAEQVGKEPGKPQDQRTINNVKIGMRLAIAECQKWIPVDNEDDLPKVCDFYLTKQSDSVKPHVYYYDGDYKAFFESKGVQVFTVTHYRQIEIK